ncbi:uncharacterized protein KQ657_004488 [Scheffersomyces spartinae]|uniref:Uncharacterized protein n=1 Tax=Scheffersomyces spartinae TaxID=45513 RepID=A0A9P8AK58_9ASCO|nr:uncharacterized protein KQ657_004488 [Scheffersomyces spartinae]KAG7194807.1 hypothetical protein KQ657_004488 [Scheffersomyces spartinae]
MPPKASHPAPQPVYKTAQFYWFLGHAAALAYSLLYTVVGYFSSSKALTYYKYALVSIIFTYLIVIKQTQGSLQRGSLLRDENITYCSFALVLLLNSSVTKVTVGSSLVSYCIFLVFHCVGYFQRNLLPLLPMPIAKQSQINALLNNFTTQFNQPALFMAASSEMLMAASQSVSLVLLLKTPLLFLINAVVFVAVILFLRLRYDSSPYTKAAMTEWNQRAGMLAARVGLYNVYSSIVLKVVTLSSIPFAKVKAKSK